MGCIFYKFWIKLRAILESGGRECQQPAPVDALDQIHLWVERSRQTYRYCRIESRDSFVPSVTTSKHFCLLCRAQWREKAIQGPEAAGACRTPVPRYSPPASQGHSKRPRDSRTVPRYVSRAASASWDLGPRTCMYPRKE